MINGTGGSCSFLFPFLGQDQTERIDSISEKLRKLLRAVIPTSEAIERFKLRIYTQQRTVVEFIKRHQTVKLIHLLRNYSAMAVVVSSSLLVSATNVAADKGGDSFAFGYWGPDSESTFTQKTEGRGSMLMSKPRDLALAPVPMASSAVNPSEEADDSFLSAASSQPGGLVYSSSVSLKDPEEDGGVKVYEVRQGDTVSSIAAANKITINTILWANDIENVDSIMPGDKIFILPVAGLNYKVKSGDNIDSIASSFKANREKIISFNDLPADGRLEAGQEIIIPDGRKEVPSQTTTAAPLIARRQYTNASGGAPTISGWKKLEGKAGSGHRFPYGYCTWYVAQRRFVPWGGNAGTWLYHAKSLGYKTGKTPQVGAIMVSSESWWGHVAVVESVSGDSFTVSEMNYKGFAKKSTRVVSKGNRVIKGFIY
ncbi:LysM peptidoglycan-binding domain-containing protein [Patescibacteria group bacterium]|nr:MAG: LysM peptidoglycan-binding domain-containing protein [Patescibacteria group bacterium]